MDLSNDPAIAHLGIYLRKIIYFHIKIAWTLREALFVITWSYKLSKYSSPGKWVKKEKQNVIYQ